MSVVKKQLGVFLKDTIMADGEHNLLKVVLGDDTDLNNEYLVESNRHGNKYFENHHSTQLSMYAWTEHYLYILCVYDGTYWLERITRAPTDMKPNVIGGG